MAYQLNDSDAKVLVTLDAIFAARLVKVHERLPQLKVVVAASWLAIGPPPSSTFLPSSKCFWPTPSSRPWTTAGWSAASAPRRRFPPPESRKDLEEVVGAGKLLEVYGMTETAPLTTMNPAAGPKKLGSIGLPLINTELKLVDPGTGTLVPLGEPGEICVRGPQVMVGYYKKPEETAKAIDKEGFMHTGDVAVMDADGYLRIVDRTKDMVIVSGFKVFSKKVEEVLAAHPAVGMIAIVGIANPLRPGSELVKACIQKAPGFASEDDDALKADLLQFAKDKLAPYEVPKEIEFLEGLPMTSVGKIDKKQLRKT
jgi:long-chain acyl-CoA synthetase